MTTPPKIKRFRVFFDEHTRTEIVVHAATAGEAKQHAEALLIQSDRQISEQFKVRSDASEWKAQNLGNLEIDEH